MKSNKQKKSAFTDWYINENGFTFITIFAMIITLAIMLPMFSSILSILEPKTNYQELSIQEFNRSLRDQLIEANSMKIVDNRLLLLNQNGENIIISRYNNQIRRQVDRTGHEILLMDVLELKLYETPYGIKTVITNLEGETFEKSFVYYN